MSTSTDQEIDGLPSSRQSKRYGWYGGLDYTPPRCESDEASSTTDIRSSTEALMEPVQQDGIDDAGHEPGGTHATAEPNAANTETPSRPNSPCGSQMTSETVIHHISEREALSPCDHHPSQPESQAGSQPASASAASLSRFTENFENEEAAAILSGVNGTPAGEGKKEEEGQGNEVTAGTQAGNARSLSLLRSRSQRHRRRSIHFNARGWFSRLRRGFMAKVRGVRGKGSSPKEQEGPQDGREAH